MVFHLAGWSLSITTSSLSALNALTDQLLTIRQTTDIAVPPLNKIIFAYGDGNFLQRLRIEAPSLVSNQVYAQIEPLDNAVASAGSPIPIADLTDYPYELAVGENLEAKVITGATAAQTTVLVGLSDGIFPQDPRIQPMVPNTRSWLSTPPGAFPPIPSLLAAQGAIGRMSTARATGTATLTANAWTNVVLTFDQAFPAGDYAIVGMRARSASSLAARLVVKGLNWRPGCIAAAGATTAPTQLDGMPNLFRYGHLGVWGYFNNATPPDVEFLSGAADTAEVVYLDVVKVA
jgi:hypothetical protein